MTVILLGEAFSACHGDCKIEWFTCEIHTVALVYTHLTKGSQMRTNIVIDDKLIQKAMQTSGLTTKRAAVEAGLRLLVQIQEQKKVRRLRGKIAWDMNLEKSRAARVREI